MRMDKNSNYKQCVYIFCHYSQEPPYNTMLRFHNWGKQLVLRGYEVTIIAASVVHNTDIDVTEKRGTYETTCDGVSYHYIKTPKYSGNGGGRIKNMLAYCFGISKFAKCHSKPDIIISSDAYVFPFVKHSYKSVPIIVDITDLWPISIIQYTGMSEYHPFIQALYEVEKIAYIKCDALIFSMEGGIDYVHETRYRKRVDDSKIFHINMGCDMEERDRNEELFAEKLPWNLDHFNIVYCGSIRQANQVKEICDAAEVLSARGYKDIDFQIYGNGDELASLKQYVKEKKLNNITFYGRIEKAKIPYILSKAKINVLTYKKVDLMRFGGSQSKLFDYLASGRPILSNADWGYNLITRYNAGIVTKNQSPEAFADAVEELYKYGDIKLDEMGKRAREAAELYDQSILVDKLCQVFDFCQKQNEDRK